MALNMAAGMPHAEAARKAGYSQHYARSKAYQLVRRPIIQSIFTEAAERLLKERNLQFDALLTPYIEALTAKIIVKSQQLGDAKEVNLPDHPTRMSAADRLVELFGASVKPKEEQTDTTVTIQIIQFTDAGKKASV